MILIKYKISFKYQIIHVFKKYDIKYNSRPYRFLDEIRKKRKNERTKDIGFIANLHINIR